MFSNANPAQQELNFGDFSTDGTGLTFDITTRGVTNLDSLTTSIHLGSVEQTITFTAAGSAGPVALCIYRV